jgi:hypothetical protein
MGAVKIPAGRAHLPPSASFKKRGVRHLKQEQQERRAAQSRAVLERQQAVWVEGEALVVEAVGDLSDFVGPHQEQRCLAHICQDALAVRRNHEPRGLAPFGLTMKSTKVHVEEPALLLKIADPEPEVKHILRVVNEDRATRWHRQPWSLSTRGSEVSPAFI